jgi:hypothetical protein
MDGVSTAKVQTCRHVVISPTAGNEERRRDTQAPSLSLSLSLSPKRLVGVRCVRLGSRRHVDSLLSVLCTLTFCVFKSASDGLREEFGAEPFGTTVSSLLFSSLQVACVVAGDSCVRSRDGCGEGEY